MTEVLAYVFECGHEGKEIGNTNKRLVCPKCGARLTQKKYKCQNEKCGKVFYDAKNGSHIYCKECAAKIKRNNTVKWLRKNGKDPKLKRTVDFKSIEEVHDRVDCVYRRKCLSNRITKNPNVCLNCNEYLSEFDNEERYLHSTKACSTSTHLPNGARSFK